jgi:hypothetical protein
MVPDDHFGPGDEALASVRGPHQQPWILIDESEALDQALSLRDDVAVGSTEIQLSSEDEAERDEDAHHEGENECASGSHGFAFIFYEAR